MSLFLFLLLLLLIGLIIFYVFQLKKKIIKCENLDPQKSINGAATDNKMITSSSSMCLESMNIPPAESSTQSIIEAEKAKMNKDELKLSPIHKKSASSSCLLEDLSLSGGDSANNTTLNGSTNNANNNNNKSGKENSFAIESKENNPNEEQKQNDANTEKKIENETKKQSNSKSESNKKVTSKPLLRSNLVKLIAGCVNEKLRQKRQLIKNNKKDSDSNKMQLDENSEKIKSNAKGDKIVKDGDEEADVDDDDEEDDDFEGEDDKDDEDDDEDGDDDDDDDDEDDDDDDDDEEEEDDDDDEDYEDEEEDEEFDLDAANQSDLDGRPGYDSGCTAVVALLRDNHLYVANAGDSRCVVCREGKAIDMSEDHKPEDESERKRIEKAGGRVTGDGRINNGLNLSRAIGDHSYKKNDKLDLSEQMVSNSILYLLTFFISFLLLLINA
jgi:protein phosphatase 1G